MSSIRSFIALELPQEMGAGLERVTGRLRSAAGEVRWVKTKDIHLTLKFLGEVEEERLPELIGCIEGCLRGIPPFSIAVRDLGAFPSDHSPQVIWIAAADESGSLAGMQRSLEDGLACIGFKKEKRPFSAHFTLGRLKSPRGKEAVRRGLAELHNTDCGSFTAGAVSLFKSDLNPSGPVYTVLKSFSLHRHN
jgi:2'-5' RNA ligase